MPVRYVIISLLLLVFSAACLPVRAEDAIEGQATAVVVSADGYLLVSAAVVRDASKITATIAGKTYLATVVKTDDDHRQTLLKVKATGLHALPFAQENNGTGNIVGYPMDSFLGTKLKIAQTWYNLVAPLAQPTAVLLNNRGEGGSDGFFLISQRGELAGMLVKGYWPRDQQTWQTPAMPASVMLPLLTAAGVKPAAGDLNTAAPADAFTTATSAIALLTVWSAKSTRRMNVKDQAVLLEVPAGEFTMGSRHDDQPVNETPQYVGIFPNEFPQHKVALDAFWIYKYAVTVGQYRQFCAATNHPMPALPMWAKDYVPIINVTWQDAQDYARWAGAALPTEAQYEKAARGTDARLFPWGTPSRRDWSEAHYISMGFRRSSGGALPVGSAPDGASPYGALDMVGNVWEWCADWYQADYYQNSPAQNPTGPATGSDRVIRGGSWFTMESEDFRCATRAHLAPEQHNYFTGFRCVVVNTP